MPTVYTWRPSVTTTVMTWRPAITSWNSFLLTNWWSFLLTNWIDKLIILAGSNLTIYTWRPII